MIWAVVGGGVGFCFSKGKDTLFLELQMLPCLQTPPAVILEDKANFSVALLQ